MTENQIDADRPSPQGGMLVIRRIVQYASGKEALLLAHSPQNEVPQFTEFAIQEMLTPEEGQ
jgi:hypothetical protein